MKKIIVASMMLFLSVQSFAGDFICDPTIFEFSHDKESYENRDRYQSMQDSKLVWDHQARIANTSDTAKDLINRYVLNNEDIHLYVLRDILGKLSTDNVRKFTFFNGVFDALVEEAASNCSSMYLVVSMLLDYTQKLITIKDQFGSTYPESSVDEFLSSISAIMSEYVQYLMNSSDKKLIVSFLSTSVDLSVLGVSKDKILDSFLMGGFSDNPTTLRYFFENKSSFTSFLTAMLEKEIEREKNNICQSKVSYFVSEKNKWRPTLAMYRGADNRMPNWSLVLDDLFTLVTLCSEDQIVESVDSVFDTLGRYSDTENQYSNLMVLMGYCDSREDKSVTCKDALSIDRMNL